MDRKDLDSLASGILHKTRIWTSFVEKIEKLLDSNQELKEELPSFQSNLLM